MWVSPDRSFLKIINKNKDMGLELKFRAWDKVAKQMTPHNFTLFGEYLLAGALFSWQREIRSDLKSSLDGLNDLVVMQFTGLLDKNEMEIYGDDLLTDGKTIFRVYQTEGGFAIKSSVWAKNLNDEAKADELIFEPLPDAQTRCYLRQSCEIIGNIYQNPELLTTQNP